MYIKKVFNILLFFIFILLYSGCIDKERLNPVDPLSPNYMEPSWVTNIFVNLDYENTTIIDEDTIWGWGGETNIKIIQNVLITGGATLTIKPGTDIEFIGVGMNSPIGIIVDDGALNAVGLSPNVEDRITFTAMDFTAAYLVFRENSIDYNSVLQYCDLSSVFVYCIHYDPDEPNNNIIIRNNRIMDLLLWKFPRMEIRYNNIGALNCISSPAVIKHNQFYTSVEVTIGIVIEGVKQPVISSNNLWAGYDYRINNKTSLTQYAKNNHWGSGVTTASNINALITNLGYPVIFQPFRTTPVTGAGSQW